MRATARGRMINTARAQIEAALADAITAELAAMWRRIYPRVRRLARQKPVLSKSTRSLHKMEFVGSTTLWDTFQQRLHQAVMAELSSGALTINQIHNAWAKAQAGGTYADLDIDPEDLIAQAKAGVGERIQNVTDDTKAAVGEAVAHWFNTPGQTVGSLVNDLTPLFNKTRAYRIASTETTRLNSAVVEARMDKLGFDEWWWQTKRDEMVCPVCRSRHGQKYHKGDPMPPAHPHCRCDPVEIVTPEKSFEGVEPQPYDPEKMPPAPPPAHLVSQPAGPVYQGPEAPTNPIPAAPVQSAVQAIKPINIKTYVKLKHKADRGGLLTQEEIHSAAAFAHKTWPKKKAGMGWIRTAQKWHDAIEAGPVPITVKGYISLSHKAQRKVLSPRELISAEAFSQKTWGKTPEWITGQKKGELYVKPEKAPVKKKPAAQPAAAAPPFVEPAPAPTPAKPVKPAWQTDTGGLSHSYLKQVDLHEVEPTWKPKPGMSSNFRYGAVLINDDGQVLLREPRGHYGGYAWTFAKGGPEPGYENHPVDVMEREVMEETGYDCEIVGLVPGGYGGDTSTTFFFVARPKNFNQHKMDSETVQTQWVSPEQAAGLIDQTTSEKGKARDHAVLAAAVNEDQKIRTGKADYKHLFADIKPPEPPKPKAPKKVYQTQDLYAQQKNFPEAVTGLKVVKPLGGSTGAQLVQDDQGRQFVMKRGKSPEHLLEEAAADAAYRAAGAKVPDSQLYQTPGGPVKLSSYLNNARTLDKVMASGTEAEKKKVRNQLKKQFAADALLANWDVIGMNADNILVDKGGQVWRIDNGGSMRTRAQGTTKGADWNDYPTEIWTMRGAVRHPGDPIVEGANKQAVSVFGDLSYREIGAQMRELAGKRTEILSAVPEDVRGALEARLDTIEHLGKTQEWMDQAGWDVGYQDAFGRGTVENRRAGISEKMPEQLTTKRMHDIYDPVLKDEKGKNFDSLRGQNSIVYKLRDLINRAGGDYSIIEKWASQQAGASWNDYPVAVKYMLAQSREGGVEEFWWGERDPGKRKSRIENARKTYEGVVASLGPGGAEKLRRSIEVYHAFTYDLLQRTNLPYMHREDDTITVMRSEQGNWIEKVVGAKPGDANISARRGAAESCSLVNDVYPVNGDSLTKQRVPMSNVLGIYTVERSPGSGNPLFLGDSENEVLVLLGRQKFNYYGSRGQYRSSPDYQKDIEAHE